MVINRDDRGLRKGMNDFGGIVHIRTLGGRELSQRTIDIVIYF